MTMKLHSPAPTGIPTGLRAAGMGNGEVMVHGLQERLPTRAGERQLEYGEEPGLGSCELISVD